ncbi:MAG TPA: hypothetical protein VFJ49_10015 [Methyloceanibacter sp.]|nr:hypothetical protein [Methyloceanibacter sp.]
MTWQKQAFYGEVSKPNGIGHAVRHKVHKLVADGNPKLAIVCIIAERIITPKYVPNGEERLVNHC